jgi:hypothetical protein
MNQYSIGNATLTLYHTITRPNLINLNRKDYCRVDLDKWVFANSYINKYIKDKDESAFYKNWLHNICSDMRGNKIYLLIEPKKIYYWAPDMNRSKIVYDTGVVHYNLSIVCL